METFGGAGQTCRTQTVVHGDRCAVPLFEAQAPLLPNDSCALSPLQVEHAFNYLEVQGIACNKPTQVSDPLRTPPVPVTSTQPLFRPVTKGIRSLLTLSTVKHNCILIVFTFIREG